MKNKKVTIAIISVVALLLVLIGVTYAYWLVTKTQTNSNILSSACLDITLDSESNDIRLSNQYPLSDEDGMKLIPYTFTVTNNCNMSIEYQVALESIGEEATAIASSALKVALDTKSELLSNKAAAQTTVSGAYASHKIGYGTLTASGNEGSSVTHDLRIWIDENAPISEMNKTYQSKISVTVGQGVTSPIKEGTMAYDILSKNDDIRTLNTRWTEGNSSAFQSSSIRFTEDSTIYFGTNYVYDEMSGFYTLAGILVQATREECRTGIKNCGKYTLLSTNLNANSTRLYEVTKFYNNGNIQVKMFKGTNVFSSPTLEGEGGLYKTTDDLGESYYYRGDVTNNYVQFGKYAIDLKEFTISDEHACRLSSCVYDSLIECESKAGYDYDGYDYVNEVEVSCVETTSDDAGKNMYWRIVRINGDGTIRLVYDGTEKVENGTTHTATIRNTPYNNEDAFNLNYGDSDIKDVVDKWYNTHLRANYGGYLTDGIFCNDKEVVETYYYDEEYNETTQENAYYTWLTYSLGASYRGDRIPTLMCKRVEDRYTIETYIGNGMLQNPVALLTAAEVFFAGGAANKENDTYYLYSGENFWTISPSVNDSYSAASFHLYFSYYGSIEETYLGDDFVSTRPVINLRADVEFTGDGSFENPYIIKTN